MKKQRTPSSVNSSLSRRVAGHIRRNALAWLALFMTLTGGAYALDKASVGSRQLKPNAVKTGKIANGAVTARKLARGSVDGSKLTRDAVDADQIKAGAVTQEKIGAGAVTSAKVAGAAITSDKVANGSITREKLAPGAIDRDMVGLVYARAEIDDVSTDQSGTVGEIFTSGPFTLKARCNMRSNGATWFSAFVQSSEDATSSALPTSPYYRLDSNTSRSLTLNTVILNSGGTTVFPVNVWTQSGRFLQASIVATSRTVAARNDCSYLITGFTG